MNRIEKTTDLFTQGRLNCAQAVLTVYGADLGIDPEQARVLGRPLGGGFGVTGQICGFLSGAALVLAHAFDQADEAGARKTTQPHVAALLNRFAAKHGSVTCNGLLGVERGTEDGERRVREQELVPNRCPGFGRHTVEILEDLLRGAPAPDDPAAAAPP